MSFCGRVHRDYGKKNLCERADGSILAVFHEPRRDFLNCCGPVIPLRPPPDCLPGPLNSLTPRHYAPQRGTGPSRIEMVLAEAAPEQFGGARSLVLNGMQ